MLHDVLCKRLNAEADRRIQLSFIKLDINRIYETKTVSFSYPG